MGRPVPVLSACLLLASGLSAQASLFRAPPEWRGAQRPGAPAAIAAPGDALDFKVVDTLGHQDDFWANSLVGDADHDGLQEIVLREVPAAGGAAAIVFHEDDGSGQFDVAATLPLGDGGLLALGDVDGLSDLFIERALGPCQHEFAWLEASAPDGFPDHEVWSAPKHGDVVDFRAVLGDSDGDGRMEFITADSAFGCAPTALRIFESTGPAGQPNHLRPALALDLGGALGNPVLADLDGDGRMEIAVAEFDTQALLVLESPAQDAWQLTSATPVSLFNAYQLAAVSRGSPDDRPILFLAGQAESSDYRVQSFEALADDSLSLVAETPVPSACGASIPQLWAADVTGSRTPELVLARLCGPVPVYSLLPGGGLFQLQKADVTESLHVVATRQTASHSGAIAVGTYPNATNPDGLTLVLESP